MPSYPTETGRPRSILLAAYPYPPCPDVGAHWPAAMAKYLHIAGHDVRALTTSAYGDGDRADAGGAVTRTWDLRLLRARLRHQDTARSVHGVETYAPRRSRLSRVLVPDRQVVTWAPFAVRAALSLHHSLRFDAVITTAPPQSTNLVGRALAASGCAWIADLRDAWNFEPVRPEPPTAVQKRIDTTLERRLLRAAHVVTCVSRPAADDLRRRLGVDALLVPNGFDPDQTAAAREAASTAEGLLDPERVSIVYTGRFGGYGRDTSMLVHTLHELAAEEPDTANRLELAIDGPLRPDERAELEADFSPLRVSLLGTLPRSSTLALQRAADCLLVIASPDRTQLANQKLFEYLAAERPILALADGTEAGRIVTALGGEAVRSDDAVAIRTALRRAANGELSPVGGDIYQYAYPALAERMAGAIELAIERCRVGSSAGRAVPA